MTQAQKFATYDLAQLNSLSKYPSILTLHALGDKGRLADKLTTPGVVSSRLIATEKIDGTNARILVFSDGSYVVGSRENLLHVSGDVLFDPAQGIVSGLYKLGILPLAEKPIISDEAAMLVLYGEFYGGRVSANSKQYSGPDEVGFRLFDVATYTADLLDKLLQKTPADISAWREMETDSGIRYGQTFLAQDVLRRYALLAGFQLVPELPLSHLPLYQGYTEHWMMLDWLKLVLPETKVHLNLLPGRAEGVVLRTADRSAIVKIRFEDYERTLKPQK